MGARQIVYLAASGAFSGKNVAELTQIAREAIFLGNHSQS